MGPEIPWWRWPVPAHHHNLMVVGPSCLLCFNIRSGHNVGLEAALRVMDQLKVDIRFLLETKLTGGIYTTWHSLGYNVLALTATLSSSGGIAIFYRGNILYKVKETQIWGPNIISPHLMMGSNRAFVVGCYIPPSDLKTLACIDKAWCKCPKGAHPILVGDLNLNLRALRTEIEETSLLIVRYPEFKLTSKSL